MMFNKDLDDFDKNFNRMQKFAIGWFIFVGLLAIAILGSIGFVVYELLSFFGIL